MKGKDIRTDFFAKTGGFLKGICHPNGEAARITEAGITWVRMDAPYPFDHTGAVSESHRDFVERVRRYAENGLRTIVITPYPDTFLRHGIDPREAQGLVKVSEVCAFLAQEYAPLGVCFQATNEMHIVHFRAPLTTEESKEFLIASLNGLRKGAAGVAIGHNSISHDGAWDDLCVEINRRTDCDYIGFDLYNGTWSDGGPQTYVEHVEQIYALLGIPVVLMEFGFSSAGGNIHEDHREILAYLQRWGYQSEAELFADPARFIEALPPALHDMVLHCAPEDKNTALRNCFPHLLKKWCAKEVFAHDEAGQAKFYETVLPLLLENPHLAGAVIYCWQDSERCFSCHAADCPCETAWGLVRLDQTPKPAYYAVKSVFTKDADQ